MSETQTRGIAGCPRRRGCAEDILAEARGRAFPYQYLVSNLYCVSFEAIRIRPTPCTAAFPAACLKFRESP
jgi:hypothetical protein